jgi:hypothetical protein
MNKLFVFILIAAVSVALGNKDAKAQVGRMAEVATVSPPESKNDPKRAPQSRPQNAMSISAPSKMDVKLTRAELIENGEAFLLEFLLTNHYGDIASYDIFGGYNSNQSMAYDNLGNKAVVNIRFGDAYSSASDFARNPLPSDTPIKITAVVRGFSPQATSFTRIQIYGCCYSAQACPGADGNFLFKNVAINRQ